MITILTMYEKKENFRGYIKYVVKLKTKYKCDQATE